MTVDKVRVNVMWEGLDHPLLALKTEEGAMGQGIWVASRSWKKSKKGSYAEPVEGDLSLLTTWF